MKDWSTTTACRDDLCPEGKVSLFKALSLRNASYEPRLLIQSQHLLIILTIVDQTNAIWLWKFPPLNTSGASGPYQWWCGNQWITPPCQSGVDANFVTYTSGHFLGTASFGSTSLSSVIADTSTKPNSFSSTSQLSSSSSSSSPATIFANPAAPTHIQRSSSSLPTATNAASTGQVPTNAAASASSQSQSNSLPSAIGAGIGVPLGIAAVGFIVFLISRQANSKVERKSINSSHESEVEADARRFRTELHDTPLPDEMEDDGRPELPGSQLVLKVVPGT